VLKRDAVSLPVLKGPWSRLFLGLDGPLFFLAVWLAKSERRRSQTKFSPAREWVRGYINECRRGEPLSMSVLEKAVEKRERKKNKNDLH
jgi:hypothetical protein